MKHQNGAVLVVSLVLLLLITAIAVSTISSSTFQTTMSTNAQQREAVFRNAESAAERAISMETLEAAYSLYLKSKKARTYSVPSSKLGANQAAEAIYVGASQPFGSMFGYKYHIFETRGTAFSTDGNSSTAKVKTEVVQGATRLLPDASGETFDL
jgi:type II secretory pathway pseudopilin PulG